MATVIVLNGTSSSGKTTVARAFQELAPRTFLNFSIDSILLTLPPAAVARITSGADITDLRLPELVRAFYACVRQLLDLGHDLVIDHAVTARYHAELLVGAVDGHHVLLVGIDCPRDVLRQREAQRGDRRLGMAQQQSARIHEWLVYDVIIDTSTARPEEGAEKIVGAIGTGGRGIKATREKLRSEAMPEQPAVIRDAQARDAAAIAAIYNHYIVHTVVTFEEETIDATEMSARMADVASAGLPWLVAEIDGRVAGYAYATKWKGRSGYRFTAETTVYLDPEFTGRGLGRALYAQLLPALRTRSIHSVLGGIALPNPASVALHERIGFRKVAQLREVGFKFGRWIDVGYWEMEL